MNLKEELKQQVFYILEKKIDIDKIIIEYPKDIKTGDLAIPCFVFSKILQIEIKTITDKIATQLKKNYEKVEIKNGYVNVFFNKNKTSKIILEEILTKQEKYGSNNLGKNKTVVLDYSAPNIAKPFGVGHLRSTVIGNSLKKIYEKNGYKSVGINYLGDWGTQFGKLIYAYKNYDKIEGTLIEQLQDLYVKFHEETNLELEDKAREEFKKLEQGNEENLKLWETFRKESLIEFQKTYDLLNLDKFDVNDGESFYVKTSKKIIQELEEKKLLEEDQGAIIVRLNDDIIPALITKKDGSSIYITRDLGAVLYRKKTYNFDEMLYVVGNEQTLHFQQLKLLLEKMNYDWFNQIKHINFGMILIDGKKMSTRKGKTYSLHELLLEAISLAKQHIEEKNYENEEEISRQIGVGAVIFNDLKNYRKNDIEFDLNEILKFEGETSSYIQYVFVRINSILKEQSYKLNNDIEISQSFWEIIYELYKFKELIIKSKEEQDPSIIAKYLLNISKIFNKIYATEKILEENQNLKEFKLTVCKATTIVLKEGMKLLGIEMPERM